MIVVNKISDYTNGKFDLKFEKNFPIYTKYSLIKSC